MIRTLVVEDDFRVAEVHEAFVARVPGFEVVGSAKTASDAVRLARSLAPDLVLLDMYLPDRPGLEVLRALRGPGMSPMDVIAITAARDVETLRAALQWGVVHYVVKPFQFSVFRERLERYAAARTRLSEPGALDQSSVDQILGLLRAESAGALPKGMSQATLELVASAVSAAAADLSAAEVAERVGVSRVTGRRYLDYLVRRGLVGLSMRYGSQGRPEHRYRWVGTGG
ncbi:MAG TPA: response regulator [Candidatus Limnocylindrales bacterium]